MALIFSLHQNVLITGLGLGLTLTLNPNPNTKMYLSQVGLDKPKAQKASSQHVVKVQRVSDGFLASCGCNGNLFYEVWQIATKPSVPFDTDDGHTYCSEVHPALNRDSRFEKSVCGRLRISI